MTFALKAPHKPRFEVIEMIKIDLLVSSALELSPDIDRVARAENFIEDGKVDARRD